MKIDLMIRGRWCLLILCMLTMFTWSFAQTTTLRGSVKDQSGAPIAGASVTVKGTTTQAMTDSDGNFTLAGVSTDGLLVVSFVGYVTREITFSGLQDIEIILEGEEETLDEVVVIGYQTVRRRDLTGSVASVSGEDLATAPVINVAQALQGKLSGVNVMSQDGRPDGAVSIRIRGGGSISQSNEPLILIDGIPGSISDIPSELVESVDVLKDASSTAIYGARGANGVVLVTTKGAKSGKGTVTYNGFAKFNNPTGYMDALKPYDYLAFKWAMLDAYEDLDYVTPFTQLFAIGTNSGENTEGIDAYKHVSPYNLQKELYNSSFSHSHDLAISGGTDLTKILVSASYMDEDGMKLMSYAKRATAMFKIDQKISDNLNLNLNLRYT